MNQCSCTITVMLASSDDCEQVNGSLAEPPTLPGVLPGPVHCPPPVPVLPARTQCSGLPAVSTMSLITVYSVGNVHQGRDLYMHNTVALYMWVIIS